MRYWIALCLALWVSTALAVAPATWDHTTEADFDKGQFHCTVASSLGEIRLANEIKMLTPADCPVAVVSDVVWAGGKVYPKR